MSIENEIHFYLIVTFLWREINGTNNITDTNISKYIKPEMAVHMKPVILLSYY
jgi:hypothetical protein